MKKLLLASAIIAQFVAPSALAVIIYNADYATDGDGFPDHSSSNPPLGAPQSVNGGAATSPEGRWALSYTSTPSTDSSGNIFKVRSGAIETTDWGGTASFESFTIDVSGYDTVDISAVGETLGASVQNGTSEFFEYFYSIDGGSNVTTDIPLSGDSAGTPVNYSVLGLDVSAASTLTVGFRFDCNGSGDGYSISSFTVDGTPTGGGSDTTPPVLVSTSPADDATNQMVDISLALTFDEGVQAGTGFITLFDGGGQVEQFDVTTDAIFSSATVTVTPSSPLSPNTAYYVQVDATAITDDATSPNAYAGIADTVTWNFTTGDFVVATPGDIVVTEIMQDPTPSNDSGYEWFEVFNAASGSIDLDGWTISDAGSNSHVINNGGPLIIPAGGYLLFGSNSDPLSNGGYTPDYVYASFTLANGDDEVILTTDGALEIDRVEYDGGPNFPDPTGAAMALINPSLDNNVGSNWVTASTPYGDGDLGTPGSANPAPATLTASLNNPTIVESAGPSASTLTITRSNTTGDLDVTITTSDSSEAEPQLTLITIFDGDADETVDIDAVDDLWADGDQVVTISVSAPGNIGDAAPLTVQDDVSDTNSLIINEVYYAPQGGLDDANGDGVFPSDDDEFIEIVNVGAAPFDLSFCSIIENGFDFNVRGPAHIFPSGTILAPGAAIVVFGGGNIASGATAGFGTAEIQKATEGGLFLSDGGDLVRLRDASDGELFSVELPDSSTLGASGSLTLSPDLATGSPYIPHTTTTAATEFSPGTQTDGTAFVTVSQSLTVTVNTADIPEEAGSVLAAFTVSLPSNAAADTDIRLESSDSLKLFVSDTVTIPSGSSSVDVEVFPFDDGVETGDATITVTAILSGFLSDSAALTVIEDDVTFTNLVINEVDSQTPGTDVDEFIELYSPDGTEPALDGLILMLFNGSNDEAYEVIDLSGITMPADGFLVLGSASVPNVDLVTFTSNGLQNGADAVALVNGSAANNPTGTPAAGITGTLIDAVVYDDGGGTDAGLIASLTPGQVVASEDGGSGGPEVDSASRVPDGGTPLNTSTYAAQTATPGATNVLPEANFGTWATANGVDGEGFDDDSDGDGIPTGVEYAIDGLDPTAFDGLGSAFNGTSLSFTKRAEAVANGDVTYSIEESTDLGATDPWEEATGPGYTNDGTTVSFDLPTGGPRAFARLKIVQAGGGS